ncbi:MAG TPA: hypothetical protein VFC51_10360 [Chloroflexota bacterium]|nr:hypothetical protein [Chloroflexota bacterium]
MLNFLNYFRGSNLAIDKVRLPERVDPVLSHALFSDQLKEFFGSGPFV